MSEVIEKENNDIAGTVCPVDKIPENKDQQFQPVSNLNLDEKGDKKTEVKTAKYDYEQRNLDHLKKLSEKRAKEMKDIEAERKKMEDNREKLKKIVLARADKLKHIKELPSLPPQEEVKAIGMDDKKKMLEKGKLRKYYRSRYASLLANLEENNRQKKIDEENKIKHTEEIHSKIKEKLGVSNVKSKVRKDIGTKEEENPQSESNPTNHSHSNSFSSGEPPLSTVHEDLSRTPLSSSATGERRKELGENKKVLTSTIFKANGCVTHKNSTKTPIVEEDLEEKKRLAKEAAEKILLRQQQFLQQITEKKIAKQKQIEEAQEKKDKMLKKLTEEAKIQMEKAHKEAKPEKKAHHPEKEVKQYSQKQVEKITKKFLERNMNLKKVDFPITDFSQWKKKHKIEKDQKVFIITDGGYWDIKKALLARNWVENKKCESNCFDLKWTLNKKEIDFSALNDFQAVNHFDKNSVITTKVGLCHNLRNLIWYRNVDIDTFFPRCFDLVDPADTSDFIEEFKMMQAENVLKEFSLSDHKVIPEKEIKLL